MVFLRVLSQFWDFGMWRSAILPQEFLWNMHTMLVAAPGSIISRRTALDWIELDSIRWTYWDRDGEIENELHRSDWI